MLNPWYNIPQLKRFEAFEIGWEQTDIAASLTSSPGENIQF